MSAKNTIKIFKEGVGHGEMPSDLEPMIKKLTLFCKNRLGFKNPPALFLKKDEKNASDALGQTAFYEPDNKSITIFITGRHTKDILRSLSHELVHHQQNLRGDLTREKCGPLGPGYAQTNKHMRNMEKEAYLMGNIIFRDWEDHCKKSNSVLKENNEMNNNREIKVSKKLIKSLIQKVLKRKLQEHGMGAPGPVNPVSVVPAGAPCPKCNEVHPPQQTGCSACGEGAIGEGDWGDNDGYVGEGDVDMEFNEPIDVEGIVHSQDMGATGGEEDAGMSMEGGISTPEGEEFPDDPIGEGSWGEDDGYVGEGGDWWVGEGGPDELSYEMAMHRPEGGFKQAEGEPTLDDVIAAKRGGATDKEMALRQSLPIEGGERSITREGATVRTPEHEHALYENRFNTRNEKLFNKLSKLWTK